MCYLDGSELVSSVLSFLPKSAQKNGGGEAEKESQQL